jgi:hypothetical protein
MTLQERQWHLDAEDAEVRRSMTESGGNLDRLDEFAKNAEKGKPLMTGWILAIWRLIQKYVSIKATNVRPDCPITELHVVPEWTVLTVCGRPIRAFRNDLTPDQIGASQTSNDLPRLA